VKNITLKIQEASDFALSYMMEDHVIEYNKKISYNRFYIKIIKIDLR